MRRPASSRDRGLELRDGASVGRDPRRLGADALEALGHARMSPLKALRLRCLDCCCGSPREVRLCPAVDCPAWPFRMGTNPWRARPSDDAKRALGLHLPRNAAAAEKIAQNSGGKIGAADLGAPFLPAPGKAEFIGRNSGRKSEPEDGR